MKKNIFKIMCLKCGTFLYINEVKNNADKCPVCGFLINVNVKKVIQKANKECSRHCN